MSHQVDTGPGWVSRFELQRTAHGRTSEEAMAEGCFEHLERSHTRKGAGEGGVDRKVFQALFAARMSRTAKGHKRYAELADRLSEQERKIQSQSLAIDHLLAFVPKRAKALPPERLAALGSTVVSLVGSASVQEWAWVREEDVDTRACHRLIVRIDAEGMTTLSILQLEDRLSEALMMEASGAEAPSVSVEVVPLSSDGP